MSRNRATIAAMLGVFIAIFTTLLPQRYRQRFTPDQDDHTVMGATISSFLQCIGLLILIMARFVILLNERAELAHKQIFSSTPDPRVVVGAHGAGILLYFEYMLQPFTLLLWYFAIEGAVRLYAVVVSKEIFATLPFQAIAWLQDAVDRRKHEAWLGPLVVDVLTAGDGTAFDLQIESCRPREWTTLHTIEYQDTMYEVAGSQQGDPPRRFIYRLRKAPAHKLVRGLHHYSPDELLPKQ